MPYRPVRPALLAAALALLCASPAAAAVGTPRLSTPADGATVAELPPFTWSKVKGADTYELQVSADSSFGSIITGRSIRTANTAATPEEAVGDGTFVWRVRAVDARGRAGRWSPVRDLRKAWKARPDLLAPTGGATLNHPAQALVLRWSTVAYASKYLLTVASDPSLAQSVLGDKPIETSATSFAIPRALPPGAYHWAVTPVDTRGHKGTPSAVGKFTAGWPSATAGLVSDLSPDERSYDPEFSWQPIPGAAAYEVEINYDDGWAPGSRVCCDKPSIGTTVTPTALLANNTYHWRVRALDLNGGPGQWNVQPDFVKSFDAVKPTIPNLHVRDNVAADPADLGVTEEGVRRVQHPTVVWDPVPGAAGYEVQVARYYTPAGAAKPVCEWGVIKRYRTPNTSWTPLGNTTVEPPGAFGNEFEAEDAGTRLLPEGQSYCVGVMAVADFDYTIYEDEIKSQLTYLDNGPGAPDSHISTAQLAQKPAFHFEPSAQAPAETAADPEMDPADYRFPEEASSQAATPLLMWDAIPGAKSYWVVIANEPDLTDPIHVGFTRQPSYSPRITLREQTTRYYWVVLPSPAENGSGVSSTVEDNDVRSFDKRSAPPQLLRPAAGEAVSAQPAFRWSGVDGALGYVLQVSTDPTFRDTGKELDSVRTAATSYTPTKTYPVDTELHWRVRAVAVTDDERGDEVELLPSPASSFRRVLPAPVMSPGNPLGGATIPVLSWSAVGGALGYELHVDQADGTRKDFRTASTSFTPIGFYGTGVWRWQVRAVFPGDVHGAYSASVPFTRYIPAPAGARAHRTKHRVLLSWQPAEMVNGYRVEVADNTSFARVIERVDTDHTTWAPDLRKAGYRRGGTLHWRVATVDEGNNAGAFASGTITLQRSLSVVASGRLRRGRAGRLALRVLDGARRGVAGAKVTIRGGGLKLAKKSGKGGRLGLKLKPRRRGTVKITVSRRGYRGATAKVKVR